VVCFAPRQNLDHEREIVRRQSHPTIRMDHRDLLLSIRRANILFGGFVAGRRHITLSLNFLKGLRGRPWRRKIARRARKPPTLAREQAS